jgi:hypothetical protein
VLLDALAARYEQRAYEPRPYLYRWLGGPSTEAIEEELVARGAIAPIGYRWVGITA